MKRLSSNRILICVFVFLALSACNKEGMGGTSAINGQITAVDHEFARAEITEVIISNGNTVEHGDYWLLNSESVNSYYYIWYDNPTWITNGDPQLNGRTGISVTFNYSDSNTDIANNTASAINANASEFGIEILNDILKITTLVAGEVPDADEVTSPFEINVDQQGKTAELSEEKGLVDEKVYIIYGDNELYSDEIRSGIDGKFQFTGLTKGDYEIYIQSLDTLTNTMVVLSEMITISKNKSNYDAGIFSVVY